MLRDIQADSIKQYRETDAQSLRNNYLAVIKLHTDENGDLIGTHQEIRNYLKACSDLAKLQHLLQKEKDDGKDKVKKESPFTEAQEKAINERVDSTLNNKWNEVSENI